MKNEKNKRSCREKQTSSDLRHLRNAVEHTRPASVNDCTGYTPVVPLCAEESEAYEDLMDIPAPARYRRYHEDEI